MVAGAPGEDEVVGLVQGLGDGLAGRVVAGGGFVAAGREEVGDGAVGVRDRRPFRDSGAQGPGQQGEEEDEEAAAGHQDGATHQAPGSGRPAPITELRSSSRPDTEATAPIVEIIPETSAMPVSAATAHQP